jgi:hypothetical protein
MCIQRMRTHFIRGIGVLCYLKYNSRICVLHFVRTVVTNVYIPNQMNKADVPGLAIVLLRNNKIV